MGALKEDAQLAHPVDYETDFYGWSKEQADLVRDGRSDRIDLVNLLDELESMGNEVLHALESSYRLLIFHLLKWRFQPERRSRSWLLTIMRERSNIARREKRNRSLKARADEIVADIYPEARREASVETGLSITTLPAECPFTLAQLHDHDFMPD